LQIATALRAAGHFVVAAVTQPFGFERPAKREQVRVGCCREHAVAFSGMWAFAG
jgi:hypothetical protein